MKKIFNLDDKTYKELIEMKKANKKYFEDAEYELDVAINQVQEKCNHKEDNSEKTWEYKHCGMTTWRICRSCGKDEDC